MISLFFFTFHLSQTQSRIWPVLLWNEGKSMISYVMISYGHVNDVLWSYQQKWHSCLWTSLLSQSFNHILSFSLYELQSGLSWRGALLPFLKFWIILGAEPPLNNLSLSHLLLCDHTITIEGAHSVMIIFSKFVVYQLFFSLTKFLNSAYQ